jgi:hypothetical protein
MPGVRVVLDTGPVKSGAKVEADELPRLLSCHARHPAFDHLRLQRDRGSNTANIAVQTSPCVTHDHRSMPDERMRMSSALLTRLP